MRKFDNKNRRQFDKRGPRKDFKRKGRFQKKDGPPPFDVLLRRYKKYIEVNGIIAECKKREHYVKPSEIRQRKINSAKRKILKQQRMEAAHMEARKRNSNYW